MDESEQDVAGPTRPTSMREVQWTDDSIRWEGGLRVKTTSDERLVDNGETDDEEDYVVDPFK
jgi:hypothetical protein